MSALERPSPAAAFTQWTFQPVVVVVAVLLAGYVYGVYRLRRLDRPWPVRRSVVFGLGLLALTWTTCGFPQVYARSLYWVWTTQTLLLWLAVPIIVLCGHPVQLARAVPGSAGRVDRLLRSRPARAVANPLVGPALVPVLSGVLFFGTVPGWSIESEPFGWALQVTLLAVGALMVLPLVGLHDEESSLAVGLALAIGCFELVLDALPGVILRLRSTPATSWFTYRDIHSWTPAAMHDQRVAGAILWCIAEIIDLPFLLLVYRRWLRVDARDAARVDAVLEAERAARRGLAQRPALESSGSPGDAGDHRADDEVPRDAPWWISDPAMQQRLRRSR